MLHQKNLEKNIFESPIEIDCLNHILETYWDIKIEKISRENFDMNQCFYNPLNNTVSIPSDLNHIEAVELIAGIERKNWNNSSPIFQEIKIRVAQLIKKGANKSDFLNLGKKYNISDQTIEKIESSSINKTTVKYSKNSTLDENISTELDKSFFRSGLEYMKFGMQSYSQENYHSLLNQLESSQNYSSEILDDSPTYRLNNWLNKDNQIYFRSQDQDFDQNEKNLREKIWIEIFHKKMSQHRNLNQKFLLEMTETCAMNEIFNNLYNFPYVLSDENSWYKIQEIMREKEIHCVGFCILAHWYLKELWISHKWVMFDDHIAILIEIWEKNYFFDATNKYKSIPEISEIIKNGDIDELVFKNGIELQCQIWDIENLLLAAIHNNNAFDLDQQGKTLEAEIQRDRSSRFHQSPEHQSCSFHLK